jgi:hypothetical protein
MGQSARKYLENNFSPEKIANQYNLVLQKNTVDFDSFGGDLVRGTQFFL